MTRLRGRAARGQRVIGKCPHGPWLNTTIIASLRVDGSTAAMAIESATDTEVFRAYVEQVLCPTLRPGDIVIMDNLSPHKSEPTLALIEAVGASVLFLPAYAPDLNPIEYLWGYAKGNDLANLAPKDLWELGREAKRALKRVRRMPRCLRAFWVQSELNLDGI